MTCIVGIARDGVVYLGADSLGGNTNTYKVEIRKDPKIFRNGDFIIGYTTSFRMGDILQYSFAPPVIAEDLSKYMRTTFIDAIRKTFKECGFAKKDSDQESGGAFLVGIKGRLFSVDSDYQVAELLEGWESIGSGEQIARGAICALLKTSTDFPGILRLALESAEYCSAYVRSPFHFVETR